MTPSYRPRYSWPSVDARSEKEAADKFKELARKQPDLFIKGAADNSANAMPLWKRLLTGK